MTQTELLIASLTATAPNGLYLDDDRYIDWSTKTENGVVLEVGTSADGAQIEMSRDEVLALQQRLTAWLLSTQ
jgi:hypothetical protein